MRRVVLVAGLPGCGKTTRLRALCHDGYLTFDDFKAGAHDDSRDFRKSRYWDTLLTALRDGRPCALADIDFCRTEARDEAEHALREAYADIKIEWHFFARDVEACEANVKGRARPSLGMDLQKLQEYARTYRIPDGANVLPVERHADTSAPHG